MIQIYLLSRPPHYLEASDAPGQLKHRVFALWLKHDHYQFKISKIHITQTFRLVLWIPSFNNYITHYSALEQKTSPKNEWAWS